ncbi:MAG: hypothetical protein K6B28_13530 [Lachnospiraceae bacterium]|nr:hypothetical protein [Lachnospiraceae bacterium]
MLQTVLLILKIIGIVLLSIIGILLVLLLLVLFVPVRYRINGDRTQEKDILCAKADLSWLLRLIRLNLQYDKDFSYSLKILMFTVKKGPKETGEKEKDREKREKNREKAKKSEEVKEKEEAEKEEEPEASYSEAEYKIETYEDVIKEEAEDEEVSDDEVSADEDVSSDEEDETEKTGLGDTEEEEERSLFEKISEYISRLFETVGNFKDKVRSFFDKLYGIYENADYYITLFNDKNTKEQIDNILIEGKKLLKHIKPGKFELYLEIGRTDPYSMGRLLSVLAIIYPFFEGGLRVEPYDDRDMTDFKLDAKGRARIFTLLLTGYRVYFHKGFKKFMKALRKKEAKR